MSIKNDPRTKIGFGWSNDRGVFFGFMSDDGLVRRYDWFASHDLFNNFLASEGFSEFDMVPDVYTPKGFYVVRDVEISWKILPMGWCATLNNGATIEESDDPSWCVFNSAGNLVSTHARRNDAITSASSL